MFACISSTGNGVYTLLILKFAAVSRDWADSRGTQLCQPLQSSITGGLRKVGEDVGDREELEGGRWRWVKEGREGG